MNTKNNLFMTALTSIVCLLPIILSLVVYNDLPERVVMQWDLEGNPNWYAHKAVAAFGIPLFFAAINIIASIMIHKDPKRESQSKIMLIISQWVIPVTSLIVVPVLLFMALGVSIPVVTIVFTFTGVLFIISGNYLPKTKQNYVIGIRLPWLFNDPENWNKTHRLAGYLYMICGIVIIIITFLPFTNSVKGPLLLIIAAILIFVPVIYSIVNRK